MSYLCNSFIKNFCSGTSCIRNLFNPLTVYFLVNTCKINSMKRAFQILVKHFIFFCKWYEALEAFDLIVLALMPIYSCNVKLFGLYWHFYIFSVDTTTILILKAAMNLWFSDFLLMQSLVSISYSKILFLNYAQQEHLFTLFL